MVFLPSDVVNQSLDAIGHPELMLGDITDGTLAGKTARRIYGQTLRQLLRTAHWAMARKKAKMEVLADRTQQTLSPQGVPISSAVELPWRFAYAWPTDCLQPRWLPWTGTLQGGGAPAGNIALPNTPLMTGLNETGAGPWLHERPARFLSSTSDQFPPVVGLSDWDRLPDLDDIEGVGLTSRRIILTDVPDAHLVYTMLVTEIELWDALFRQAMVAVLGERLAYPLIPDKKEAIAARNAQMAIAKDAIREARVASANESGFPQSTDQVPDWIRARRARAGYGGGWDASGAGGGYLFCGYSAMAFGDGSVF